MTELSQPLVKSFIVAFLILSHALSAMLGAEVKAQLLPPPPVSSSNYAQGELNDGFKSADRALLQKVYSLERSLWLIFNRNKLEQKILDEPISN